MRDRAVDRVVEGAVAGVGVDVADAGRFERLLRGGADRVWAHWFTESEAEACRRHPRPGLAAACRFAVKEATYKAVGAEFSGAVRWRDIEVLSGEPSWRVHLHGEVAATAAAAGVEHLHATTARTGGRVMAMVIAETSRPTSAHTTPSRA